MKGKKLVIAVILALIVCLVLIPTCAFAAEIEESNPVLEAVNNNPTVTETEEASANEGGDDPANENAGGVENPAPSASPAPVEENQVVKEETEEQPAPATGDAASVESSTPLEKRDYTLTLKNGDKHSVVAGDSTSSVSQIFKELEVSGEIESIEGSNSDLFTIEKDGVTGEWVLVSKQPFTTEEFVMVKLAGQDEPIIIKVTDPEEVLVDLNNGDVTVTDGSTETGKTIVIKYYDDSKTLYTKNVENGSTIHVKQTDSDTKATTHTISVTLNNAGSNVAVILDNLNMSGNKSMITAYTEKTDSTVTLELDGYNEVKTNNGTTAAIRTYGNGTFVIQDNNNIEGRLYVENSGGTAAAIGGNDGDNIKHIVISHANVEAVSKGGQAAAIGAGQNGNVESIVIEDNAQVIATSKSTGAAIGAGKNGDVRSIVIKDNATVVALNENSGAAIGAGENGAVDKITIDNAIVYAKASLGAAIGGGRYGADTAKGYTGSMEYGVREVTINDSYVYAEGMNNAIGGGYNTPKERAIQNISISGSSIVDAKGTNGVAIGVKDYYVEPDTDNWAEVISDDSDDQTFNTKVICGIFDENILVYFYVDDNAVVVKENGKYGVNESVYELVKDASESGEAIEVVKAPENTSINGVPSGVTIVNNSGNTIFINGVEVEPGTSYTVPEASVPLSAKYYVIEGKNQQWTEGDLEFKLNSKDVVKVLIDGVEVEFTVAEDGTVTIAAAVIEKLESGLHEIEFVYADGSCKTVFTVK